MTPTLLAVACALLALFGASIADRPIFTTHVCSAERPHKKCPAEPRTVTCASPDTCFISSPVFYTKVDHTDHVYRLYSKSTRLDSKTPLDRWARLENQKDVDLPTVLFHISVTGGPDYNAYAAGVGVLEEPSITYTPAPGKLPFQPATDKNPRILSLGLLPNHRGERTEGIRGALYDLSIGASPEMGIILLSPSGGSYGEIKFQNTLFARPLAIAFWTDSTFVMVARERDAADKQIVVMWTVDAGQSWETIHRFPMSTEQYQLGTAKVECGVGGCVAASGARHADFVFISFGMWPQATVKAVSIDAGMPVDVLALAISPSEEAVIVSLARPVGRASEHAEATAVYLHSLPGDKGERQNVWKANGIFDMTVHRSQDANEYTGVAFSDVGTGILVGVGKDKVGVYTVFSRA